MTNNSTNAQQETTVKAVFELSPIALADAFFASLESNLKKKDPPFSLPYDLFHEHKSWFSSKNAQLGNTQDESSRFMGFVNESRKSAYALQATLKVFPLCKDSYFRLIAAALSHDDGVSVSTADIAILRDFISRRLTTSRTTFHDMLVVAATAFSDDCQPVASPPCVLCTPTVYNLWDFHFPQAVFSTETINFFLHTLPGSPDVYADRLAFLIDHWPKTIYCTKDALRQKFGLHPSIPDAFYIHWLDTLFQRAAHSRNMNDRYAKDNRGVIYPPNCELPDGHGAKRVKRFS